VDMVRSNNEVTTVTATCLDQVVDGQTVPYVVLGGGARVLNTQNSNGVVSFRSSFPSAVNQWTSTVQNTATLGAGWTISAYAVCAPVAQGS
jgi:hypothetical protein